MKFSKEYRIVSSNISALSILQISNYVFPLITFPYVVRVIGPEKFGLINLIAAIFAYFAIVLDFGFNFSATREISLSRNNSEKINQYISSIYSIKIILLFLGIILFSIIFSLFDFPENYFTLSVFTLLSVVSVSFFPTWFFQGIENMKFITIITISVRILSVIAIFLFVRVESDFIAFVIINAFSAFVITLVSIFFLIFIFGVKLSFQSKGKLLNLTKESWNYFFTNVGINLYTTTNVVILGLFTNNQIVGYWVGVDKIRMAFQNVIGVFSQAVFPRIATMLNENYKRGIDFTKQFAFLGGLITFLISLFTFVYAENLVLLILGNDFLNAVILLKIIAFLPFIIFFSNIFGIQLLMNLGRISVLSKIILFAAVVNLLLSMWLVPKYLAVGTAQAVLITEIIVTLLTVVAFFFNKTTKSEKSIFE